MVKSGKKQKTKVVTYSKLCSGYATLVEPVGVKGAKNNAKTKENAAKLAARTDYEVNLAKFGGILLEHSVAGFQFRKMYCKPKKTSYEITENDRKKSCVSLLARKLGESRVYEEDRGRHDGLGKRQSDDFLWKDEMMTVQEACAIGAMKTCKPPEKDETCIMEEQHTQLETDCGKLADIGPVTATGFDQKASITCSNNKLSISFTPVSHATSSLVACHHKASLVEITPEWAVVARGLAEQYLSQNEAADANAIKSLRESLTQLALKNNGIPHALRPFAWAFLAHRPANPAGSWQMELDFNPNKLPLSAYFQNVVTVGLTKWNTICKQYKSNDKVKYAPCDGFTQMTKDVHRLGNVFLGATKVGDLYAQLRVDEGKKYRTMTQDDMDSYIKRTPDGQSSRVEFYLNMNLATEELFQKYHGTGPMYRGKSISEFSQNRAFFPIFFLASILPPETAFLVRSYMLAEAEPLTAQAKNMDLLTECSLFGTNSFVSKELSSKHEDVFNSRIFDRVKNIVEQHQPTTKTFFLAAEEGAKRIDPPLDPFLLTRIKIGEVATMFDAIGTTCKSRDMLLTDLLWRSRDAEPAYRIADLQLLLPRDEARRVVDAAFRAFAVMYHGRLGVLEEEGPLTAVYESIICSVRAIASNDNYDDSVSTVSDLYSPLLTDTDSWFKMVLATVRGEPISAVLEAADSKPGSSINFLKKVDRRQKNMNKRRSIITKKNLLIDPKDQNKPRSNSQGK